MKILILVTLLPLLAAAEPDSLESDKRVVGNTTVDLTPVNQWFKDKKGERPMKHWKKVVVTDVQDHIGPSWHCSATVEGGEKLTIYLNNMPETIRTYVQSVRDMDGRIKDLEAELAEDRRNREIAWNRYVNLNSGDYAVVSSGRRGIVSDTDGTRQATAYAYDEKIKTEQEQLTALRGQYRQLTAQSKKAAVLAMFTGSYYAQSQVWDAGRPIQ